MTSSGGRWSLVAAAGSVSCTAVTAASIMSINEQEKYGIVDLLMTEEQNIPILLQLAKSVTGNIFDITSANEALNLIFTHIGDTAAILNKRLITKEVLFKYLHNRHIPITQQFTKLTLANKVIEYWNQNSFNTEEFDARVPPQPTAPAAPTAPTEPTAYSVDANGARQACHILLDSTTETEYPIHLLARKFTEWFFENFNKNNLKTADFWSDAKLKLEISTNELIEDCDCVGATDVLENLLRSKMNFDLFYNPNLTHLGTQGRMDVHGLVLVLACGTLHTQEECVGVFECVFGLLRDPFAENNWKIKTLDCTLRSKNASQLPTLQESGTLQNALALAVPKGDLT